MPGEGHGDGNDVAAAMTSDDTLDHALESITKYIDKEIDITIISDTFL